MWWIGVLCVAGLLALVFSTIKVASTDIGAFKQASPMLHGD
jgi:hypothetical protein